MITGCLWEKAVFNCYLFAKPFYWEDVVSMFVMILHTIYLITLLTPFFTTSEKLIIALVAYSAYLINAIQFLLKFRAANIQNQQILEGASA
jgi:3-vinyl bacteriochlorophyllide hydratase